MTDPSPSTPEENTPKKVWYAPHMHEAYGPEEEAAVAAVLRAGWLAPGPETAKFEARVAALFAQGSGLMVNSGSSANLLALLVAGLSRGDHVVTPGCTFATCLAPMEQLGLRVTLVDVEVGRYVPSAESVIAAIEEDTRCVFVPDLLGKSTDWARIRAAVDDINAARRREAGGEAEGKEGGGGGGGGGGGSRDIVLIEDCADTIRPAPHADLVTTSFYASHVITAGGGGGMLMFGSGERAERFRRIALQYRDWGRIGDNSERVEDRFNHTVDGVPYDYKFLYSVAGYNFKSCEMNAAFGLAQLDKLDAFLATRRSHVRRYIERLRGSSYVLPDDSEDTHWLAFPLMHPRRMEVLRHLEANGVQTRVLMAGNVSRHPAFRERHLVELPNADRIMAEGFLVGAHHGLTTEDVDRVCDLLIAFDSE